MNQKQLPRAVTLHHCVSKHRRKRQTPVAVIGERRLRVNFLPSSSPGFSLKLARACT